VLAGDTRLLAARRGPAGLYIGSKTTAEIGLSIMAEVVAAKDGVDAVCHLHERRQEALRLIAGGKVTVGLGHL
jgi:xanthine/CO dehydrogenase XdhC/CoxF family maturation factor